MSMDVDSVALADRLRTLAARAKEAARGALPPEMDGLARSLDYAAMWIAAYADAPNWLASVAEVRTAIGPAFISGETSGETVARVISERDAARARVRDLEEAVSACLRDDDSDAVAWAKRTDGRLRAVACGRST